MKRLFLVLGVMMVASGAWGEIMTPSGDGITWKVVYETCTYRVAGQINFSIVYSTIVPACMVGDTVGEYILEQKVKDLIKDCQGFDIIQWKKLEVKLAPVRRGRKG